MDEQCASICLKLAQDLEATEQSMGGRNEAHSKEKKSTELIKVIFEDVIKKKFTNNEIDLKEETPIKPFEGSLTQFIDYTIFKKQDGKN